MDFTLKNYFNFLISFNKKNYTFASFSDVIHQYIHSFVPLIILRHDVDKLPFNALVIAKLEKSLGIKGTYYFRIIPESFDENIISQIADLGHEVGFHYEELDTVVRSMTREKRREFKIQISFDRLRMTLHIKLMTGK